jgi:restriction system protein
MTYSNRSGFGELLLGLIFWGYILSLLYTWLGWGWFLTIIFTSVFSFCIFVLFLRFKEKREREVKAKLPCKHGIIGANQEPCLCQVCQKEIEERRIAAEAEHKAKLQKQQAEKQRIYNEWLYNLRLPEYLISIDPRDFEHLVCELFRRLGYKAEVTAYIGDNGIDAYLEKDGEKSILQCKRVQGSVGEPIIRDLYGAMHASCASSAFIVTTGSASNKAKQWVGDKPIRIIEFQELRKLIDDNFKEDEIVPESFSVEANGIRMCPRCGSALRQVKSRTGKFLGCTSYPNCRYTQPFR